MIIQNFSNLIFQIHRAKCEILNCYKNCTDYDYSKLYLECEDHIINVYAKFFDIFGILLRFYHIDTFIDIILNCCINIIDFIL